MTRLLRLATMIGMVCLPIESDAQYQIIELTDVQLAKSLSAVVQDPSGSPLSDVLVQEFSPDWKTVLRTSATDNHGRFTLARVQGRKIYCLQLSTPGFDPLRLRVQVDRRRGVNLKLKLTIAT